MTVMLEWASRPMARNTSCMAGAWPMISVACAAGGDGAGDACSRCSSTARRTVATATSTSNGFGRYSNAPDW